MNTIIKRTLSLGQPVRARLIKFRYGSTRDQAKTGAGVVSSGATSSAQTTKVSGEPIYDFQLPPRWRRRPLDEKEIEAINSGCSINF